MRILEALLETCEESLVDRRDRALLTCALHPPGMTASELIELKVADLEETADGLRAGLGSESRALGAPCEERLRSWLKQAEIESGRVFPNDSPFGLHGRLSRRKLDRLVQRRLHLAVSKCRSLDFLETWNLIATTRLFQSLRTLDLARIAQVLRPRILEPGVVVLQKGDPADGMYFVTSGQLQVELDENTAFRMTGEFFGEIALLDPDGVRTATVRTLTRCELLELRLEHFGPLMARHKQLEEVIRNVAKERIEADRKREKKQKKGRRAAS